MIQRDVPIRAVIYARVATVAQADGGSQLQAQTAACRQLAESLGAVVVNEYWDVGAGASLDRSGLQAALEAARHDVDVILCERPDGLARGVAKLHEVEAELDRHGVTVHYARESSPERRQVTSALASLDAQPRLAREER